MKNKFKDILKKYYEKLSKEFLGLFGTYPTIYYDTNDSEIDSEMIVSEPTTYGESVWQFKEVGDYDFSKIEEKIGFKMSEELKAYYSTYLFLHLAGELNKVSLYFDALKSKEYIEKRVLVAQKDGEYYFKNTEIFALGIAEFMGDDAYVIFYDNKTGKVFVYENDTENKIEFSESLLELLDNMTALL